MNAVRLIFILIPFCMAVQSFGQTTGNVEKVESAYDSYARMLRIFVDGSGMVNYEGIVRDRELHRAAVADIGSVNQRAFAALGEEGQLAFLLNAYNLFAIDVVVSNWPIKRNWIKGWIYPGNSIRQIGGEFDGISHQLLSNSYTLDEIEHNMIREQYNDPRIHMALVCAAMSCPPLRNSPYKADSLNSQLDHQVRRFLSEAENFMIDRNKAEIQLSEIFDWYGEDWVKAGYTKLDSLPPPNRADEAPSDEIRAVLEFVAGYVDDDDRRYIEAGGNEVEFSDYDWSLNSREGVR